MTKERNLLSMAGKEALLIIYILFPFQKSQLNLWHSTSQWMIPGAYQSLHTTAIARKAQAGRYRVTRNRSRPLTYEMANQPFQIAHRKSWNSWNTSKFPCNICLVSEIKKNYVI